MVELVRVALLVLVHAARVEAEPRVARVNRNRNRTLNGGNAARLVLGRESVGTKAASARYWY
jgi:hypothetical protein